MRIEEGKMVEFRGFLGDLVFRTEREQREGLSEGGGISQVTCLARDLRGFFYAFFLLLFSLFFVRNNRAFAIGLGKICPVLHF